MKEAEPRTNNVFYYDVQEVGHRAVLMNGHRVVASSPAGSVKRPAHHHQATGLYQPHHSTLRRDAAALIALSKTANGGSVPDRVSLVGRNAGDAVIVSNERTAL